MDIYPNDNFSAYPGISISGETGTPVFENQSLQTPSHPLHDGPLVPLPARETGGPIPNDLDSDANALRSTQSKAELFFQALPITCDALAEGGGERLPCLRDALLTTSELIDLPIEPRLKLMGEWFRQGDLGYIFAPRGHGKTWFTMLMTKALCENAPFGEWCAGSNPLRVIYWDAEMNLPDVQERARLIGVKSDRFVWLQNERVREVIGRGINVADPHDQLAISSMLENGDVFVIDNLSTASCGMAENDNDAFDQVKNWLLELRTRKITVVIVHHAGRNGEMRGASRREDMAHWIISLKDTSGDGETKKWVTSFKKCRNCNAVDAPPMLWSITIAEGSLKYSSEKHTGPEAMLELIRLGVDKASDLAEELSCSSGCISKWAKKLEANLKIRIEHRKYLPL